MVDEQVEQPSDIGQVVMDAARRILNVVQAVYGECDNAALSTALAAASGMALARHHWPYKVPYLDLNTIGQSLGSGVRQGFQDKTHSEVSACRGRA